MRYDLTKNFYIKYHRIFLIRIILWSRKLPGVSHKVRKMPVRNLDRIYGVKKSDITHELYFLGFRFYSKLLSEDEDVLLRFFFSRKEKNINEICRSLEKSDIVRPIFVEIGAGIGVVSKSLCQRYKHRFLYEPSSVMFKYLSEYRMENNTTLLNSSVHSFSDISKYTNAVGYANDQIFCFGTSVLSFIGNWEELLIELNANGVSFVFIERDLQASKIPSNWFRNRSGLYVYSNISNLDF